MLVNYRPFKECESFLHQPALAAGHDQLRTQRRVPQNFPEGLEQSQQVLARLERAHKQQELVAHAQPLSDFRTFLMRHWLKRGARAGRVAAGEVPGNAAPIDRGSSKLFAAGAVKEVRSSCRETNPALLVSH